MRWRAQAKHEPQRAGEIVGAPMDEDRSATVYFDGSCALCRAEIAHYRKRDTSAKIAFVDVSEPESEMGSDLTREQAMARLHLRYSDGNLVTGANAFVAIWGLLPAWRWAARIARLPGVTPLLERLYRLFLPARPTLSRAFGRLARAASTREP